MALFRGIQEYIALDANNIARVEDSGNIFLYPLKAIQYYVIIYGEIRDTFYSAVTFMNIF